MNSLTRRVIAAGALVLTFFIVVTALALERAFEQSAHSAMRDRLFAQLYLVMAATEVRGDGQLELPAELSETRFNLPGSGLSARIGNDKGDTLWQSPSAVGLQLPTPSNHPDGEQFGLLNIKGEELFMASLAIEWQTDPISLPLQFSVTESPRPYFAQINRYRQTLWGWLGAMAAVALLALLAALSWGLRPLRTAASELAAIESGKQEGLQQEYPRELKRLTDNINTLLRHEHAQQARYKNALGDLAHSLKTPLAVLRGLDSDSAAESRTLHEQIDRMDNIVQYQLQRAATAGRQQVLAAPLLLRPTIERLLATLQKVYFDKGVKVELALQEKVAFHGNEGDLMELLGNLLDNAFKWASSTIYIAARCEGETLQLEVADDGPGIDAAQADQVLQRGVRLDEATPGHGIGLPLVRDIVAAYGGGLEIGRATLGGALFRLQLPGCSD